VSSSDHSSDIPQTRDGAQHGAADTDPVGPVTPELALVDPGLAPSGEIDSEVTMSSMQFGDGPTFSAAESAQPSLDPLPAAPLQPIAPLAPPVPALEPTLPTPVEPAGVIPVSDMRDVPLGTLVFRAGLLPEERLEEALQEGMKTGKRLGEILLERGWVSETDLGRLLAGQKGLPFVELNPSAIDLTAPTLLHPEKARLHGALPIGFEDGVPVVAVADPSNNLVVENIRRALACEPVLVVAGRDALQRAINQVYGLNMPEQTAPELAADEAPAPVVEPRAQPAPAVEAHPAAVAEPQQRPVGEPAAPSIPVVPVPPPQPAVEPVVAAAPVVPEVPQVAEPVAPVAPPPASDSFVEPAAAQPLENGDGVWLGEPDPVYEPAPMQQVETEAVQRPEVFEQPLTQLEPAFEVATPEPAPVAPPETVAEAAVPYAPVAPTEPEPVAGSLPEPDVPEATTVDLKWAVVLRLADGERLEVGAFPGEAEAVEGARGVVAQIASEQTWPFFAGRFIRPEAIVSVDLVELEVSRWLGSQARAGVFGSEDHPSP
jgi:Type II secretion system (T2SS), protein E, N-terminal domain